MGGNSLLVKRHHYPPKVAGEKKKGEKKAGPIKVVRGFKRDRKHNQNNRGD